MWGKIIIPMYRLQLHGVYILHGPHCLLSEKKAVTLNHSLTHVDEWEFMCDAFTRIWCWIWSAYDVSIWRVFLAATKQLYEWFSPSVCPSVCLSVRLSVRLSVTPFWLCSHHPIIMKFSEVITSDKSDVHAKGQGQRSKVKVTEVTTQLNRFRTVTPVWIHIWWWNDTYSSMLLRRGALLFFKVIRQISRSHGAKIAEFDPDWAFPDCNSSLNSPMAMKCCTKLEVA